MTEKTLSDERLLLNLKLVYPEDKLKKAIKEILEEINNIELNIEGQGIIVGKVNEIITRKAGEKLT